MHPVLFHIGSVLIPSYGALAAGGVLVALVLAQQTAQSTGISSTQIWNLCVIALFAALAGARLLLIAVNLRDIVRHPVWLLGLATVHHPVLAAAAALIGLISAWLYARWQRMPLLSTADALAAPVALGLACEQIGTLMAGSGFGTPATAPWAITYTSPLALRWSGTPLGIPLHPVQAYAAVAALTLSILLLVLMPMRRQAGDITGVALVGGGVTIFATEFWRDWDGRGAILHGAVDGPQIAAVLMVIAGAVILRQRKGKQAMARELHV